jgi:hypothetical protein
MGAPQLPIAGKVLHSNKHVQTLVPDKLLPFDLKARARNLNEPLTLPKRGGIPWRGGRSEADGVRRADEAADHRG